jgi:hypothetical protein
MVPTNRLIFALFAVAILFSTVREWSVPVACARMIFLSSAAATQSHQ